MEDKVKQPRIPPHLMVDEIRADGRWERHCECGIGHTVGHWNADIWNDEEYVELHGCCGHCADWPRMERK